MTFWANTLMMHGRSGLIVPVPTFRSYAGIAGNSTTQSAPLPTGYQAGDKLLIWAVGSTSVSTPSGWTREGDQTAANPHAAVFSRTATGSDGSNVSVTFGGVGASFVITAAVSGASVVTMGTITRNTSTGTITGSGITAPASGVLIGFYYYNANALFTAPSGMTASTAYQSGNPRVFLAYQEGVGPGSTGNKNATITGSGTTEGVLVHLS